MAHRPGRRPFRDGLDGLKTCQGLLWRKFAREAGLPEERAAEWRRGEVPTSDEVRDMMSWACRVPGGVAVLLTDCFHLWPIEG